MNDTEQRKLQYIRASYACGKPINFEGYFTVAEATYLRAVLKQVAFEDLQKQNN